MQKVIIVLSISTLFSFFSHAQKIQGGLKISGNLNWLNSTTTTYANDGVRIGWGWGVMADYQLAKNYFFSPSLDFKYAGVNLEIQDTLATHQKQYSLNYVALPLCIKMKTNEIGYMKYFGQFGVEPSFLLKAFADSQTDSTLTSSTFIENDENVKSQMFPLRLGLVVGLGCEYNFIGSTSLVASLLFNNGFVNIFKNPDTTTIEEHANMNHVSLSIGIVF